MYRGQIENHAIYYLDSLQAINFVTVTGKLILSRVNVDQVAADSARLTRFEHALQIDRDGLLSHKYYISHKHLNCQSVVATRRFSRLASKRLLKYYYDIPSRASSYYGL